MDYIKEKLKVKLPSNFQTIDPETQKKEVNSWWELLRFSIFAFIIILPIRLYIIQPFIVSGESMVPTFHNKDYLIIDEISYRFQEPKRGDVIVFEPPNQPKGLYYIKRIIGLPGDTVILKGTQIIIKNAENPEGLELREPYIQNITTEDSKVIVPDGNYFVMGDNRPRSSDSRAWGLLPASHITGRALVRLFPFQDITVFPGAHTNYTDNKTLTLSKN